MENKSPFEEMADIATKVTVEIRNFEKEIKRATDEIATTRKALTNEMILADKLLSNINTMQLVLEDILVNSKEKWEIDIADYALKKLERELNRSVLHL